MMWFVKHGLGISLALALIVSLTFGTIAGAPAAHAAAPTMSVTPGTVAPGDTVSITAAGFAPHVGLTILISGHDGRIGFAYTDANGNLPPTRIGLPSDLAVGAHTLSAVDATAHVGAGTPLTLAEPVIAVSPATVAPGGTVTVSGHGFAPRVGVTFIVSGHDGRIGFAYTDANGNLPPTRIGLPSDLAVGAHTLSAVDATAHNGGSVSLIVGTAPPTMSVTPGTVAPGDTVSITAAGFAPHVGLTILISGHDGRIGFAYTDANGNLPPTRIGLPSDLAVGAHTLSAVDATAHVGAGTPLTVTAPSDAAATLAVTPSSTNRGGLITISGSQWAPNEPLVVAIKGMSTPLATITTTAQGIVPPTGITIPYGVGLGARALQVTGSFSKHTLTTGITVHPLNPSISLSSGTANAGSAITVTGKGFGSKEQITLSLDGQALPTSPPVITTTNGTFTAAITVPAGLLRGANTISASGNESRVSAAAALKGVLPVATTLYFAGASTMSGELASLPILNANAQPAHIELTFYYQHGAPGHGSIDVPANSRGTADLNKLAGADRAFGVKLVSDHAVTAQLRVDRDGKDGYGLLGITTPNTTWYLAEGYTGLTFHETLAIVNPGGGAASVRLRLLPFGGRAAREVTVSVAAQSTRVVDVNSLMPNQSLSVIANASAPVVLERTLTFSKDGLSGANGYGVTAKTGTNTPATSWIFAEGTTTTRFQTFLTVLNPNAASATVTASFYGQTGGSLGSKTIVVAGMSRANLKLNDFLHASGIASVVTSNLPVVVERPMYFGSPNAVNIAGSDVFGRNGADLAWAFPGGNTSGRDDYLLIYNPSSRPAEIDATFYGANGTMMTRRISVPPTVRYNVNVNALVPGLAAQHGVTLRSANGVSFVAEQTIFAPNFSALHSTQGFAL